MADHTPAPWAVASNHRAIIREIPDIADGYDHYMVGVMSSHSLIGHEEATANAAFIVKACNSHDALVKALEWYAKDYDHALGCSQWDGGARARAILADVGTVGGGS